MSEPWFASSPEFVAEWDVYRDADGNAVTYCREVEGPFGWSYVTCHGCDPPTDEQLAAIRHAVKVWRAVCVAENSDQMDGTCDLDGKVLSWAHPNLAKSRLLHRLIHLGLPPTRTKPPIEVAGPAWWLLPGGDPFAASAPSSTEEQ